MPVKVNSHRSTAAAPQKAPAPKPRASPKVQSLQKRSWSTSASSLGGPLTPSKKDRLRATTVSAGGTVNRPAATGSTIEPRFKEAAQKYDAKVKDILSGDPSVASGKLPYSATQKLTAEQEKKLQAATFEFAGESAGIEGKKHLDAFLKANPGSGQVYLGLAGAAVGLATGTDGLKNLGVKPEVKLRINDALNAVVSASFKPGLRDAKVSGTVDYKTKLNPTTDLTAQGSVSADSISVKAGVVNKGPKHSVSADVGVSSTTRGSAKASGEYQFTPETKATVEAEVGGADTKVSGRLIHSGKTVSASVEAQHNLSTGETSGKASAQVKLKENVQVEIKATAGDKQDPLGNNVQVGVRATLR